MRLSEGEFKYELGTEVRIKNSNRHGIIVQRAYSSDVPYYNIFEPTSRVYSWFEDEIESLNETEKVVPYVQDSLPIGSDES